MNTYNLEYTLDHLEQLCDLAAQSSEGIVIERLNKPDVALVSLRELNGLRETLHLLSSHENASRIFEAWEDAKLGNTEIQTVDELFAEIERNSLEEAI
jgi:antitoxin YefM